MRFDILTLFPEAITPYLQSSIIGRAQSVATDGAGPLLTINVHNIRDYAQDKHKITDDTPYGGGAGMVMKIEPIDQALAAVNQVTPREQQHVIVLSARGTPFTQAKAQELAASGKNLTLICGRYEGIDQRVADHLADEEISVGPYVLAGGELGALVVMEAVARLIPGVLGNPDSLLEESFTSPPDSLSKSYKLKAVSYSEYPQYTKPEDYKGWKVPDILLSGNHGAIKEWREEHSQQ